MIKRVAKVVVAPVLLYGLLVGSVIALPHRLDGFGRINAHQAFAALGASLSFGFVDRTLADWYMQPGTVKDQAERYDPHIYRSFLVLAPVYLAWGLLLSFLVSRIRRGE